MTRLNQILLAFSVFTLMSASQAQDKKLVSLDSLFAGVPLRSGFDQWHDYVSTHPQLGIDSISPRGYYSSFKKNWLDHFPFSGAVGVKLLYNEEKIDLHDGKTVDTVKAIMIEGLFTETKEGIKQSRKAYQSIRKKLNPYYRSTTEMGYACFFSKGLNNNFPDCMMYTTYSKTLKLYVVIIAFVDGKIVKDLFLLNISG